MPKQRHLFRVTQRSAGRHTQGRLPTEDVAAQVCVLLCSSALMNRDGSGGGEAGGEEKNTHTQFPRPAATASFGCLWSTDSLSLTLMHNPNLPRPTYCIIKKIEKLKETCCARGIFG